MKTSFHKKIQSIGTSSLAVALISSVPFVSAGTLTDISTSQNKTAINYLYSKGIIAGYSDGSFKPSNSINRAELAKILVTATGTIPTVSVYHNCFTDVTNEWFASYVCYAKAKGWITGYADGSFKPSNAVNTAEAIKMIVNAQGMSLINSTSENTYKDVSNTAWYAPYIQTAHAKNLLQTTSGTLGVAQNMTRGLVAESMYRAIAMKAAGQIRFGGNTAPSTSSSSVATVQHKYKDGTYDTVGNYFAPSGAESIQVSITIKDDVITDTSYAGTATHGRSQQYQQVFGASYKASVIGKSIDSLTLSVVNGASLTTRGFNDALTQIKAKALAA